MNPISNSNFFTAVAGVCATVYCGVQAWKWIRNMDSTPEEDGYLPDLFSHLSAHEDAKPTTTSGVRISKLIGADDPIEIDSSKSETNRKRRVPTPYSFKIIFTPDLTEELDSTDEEELDTQFVDRPIEMELIAPQPQKIPSGNPTPIEHRVELVVSQHSAFSRVNR
jgi:hypothetical protein